MMTKCELSLCFNKFSQLVLNKIMETSNESLYNVTGAYRVKTAILDCVKARRDSKGKERQVRKQV